MTPARNSKLTTPRMRCVAWLPLAVLLTGCAASTTRLEGDAGPVVWRVTDVGVVKRGADDVYAAKLIIKEMRGTTITLTRYELAVSDLNLVRGAAAVYTGRWVIRPNAEWTLNLGHSLVCPPFPGGCGSPLTTSAPEFSITLNGTTSEGQAVNVAITVSLPPTQLRMRGQ